MNREEAIELFVKNERVAQAKIGCILHWNENGTIKQNAIALGYRYHRARALAQKFGLRYKR